MTTGTISTSGPERNSVTLANGRPKGHSESHNMTASAIYLDGPDVFG